MNQKQYLKCVTHPERDINMIYMGKDSKYDSRLACNKCLEEYKTIDGFKDYFDVIEIHNQILNNINYTLESNKGPYNGIEIYLNAMNVDISQQIQKLKESFNRIINVLTKYFEKGLDQFKQFQTSLQNTHQSFSQLVGHSNFQAKTQALLDIDEQHYSKEWQEMEESLDIFIKNFHEGGNDEIKGLIDKLERETCQPFFENYTQAQDQFKSSITKAISQMDKELNIIQSIQIPISPLISDPEFSRKLLRSTYNYAQTNRQCNLIYKGTTHGMSSNDFWEKCNKKKNLLIICKGQNQHVFGGYSPCTWIADNIWKQDETVSSFLFSFTQRQIYKLNQGNTLYGHQNQTYGPYFIDFQVPQNFQNCTSVLKNFQKEGVVVANPSTHLMGVEKETLIEMEVYQIK